MAKKTKKNKIDQYIDSLHQLDDKLVIITGANSGLGFETAKVALKITHCEPAIRGDTVNKAMKDAELETGLKVRVPLFIDEGEVILVRTDNGAYDGRA